MLETEAPSFNLQLSNFLGRAGMPAPQERAFNPTLVPPLLRGLGGIII